MVDDVEIRRRVLNGLVRSGGSASVRSIQMKYSGGAGAKAFRRALVNLIESGDVRHNNGILSISIDYTPVFLRRGPKPSILLPESRDQ